MEADKSAIEWLLFDSKIPVKEIYQQSGVKRTTVIDLVNKTSSIEKMRFDNAAKLTKLAKTLREPTTKE
ncbi:hypothetical protein ACFC3Z_12215 [Enterococcus thailandicus]|uniref:hypothetical protein n=1 Tax=Enterococcus thailandicus TaxID=417368 RepID=UPI0035E1D3FE